jgi:competence protein ComEC
LSRGVEQIDRMILSNGDQDHAGGAQALQSAFPVGSMLSGEVERVPGATACQAGTHWIWEGVTFRILHPAAEDRFSESNNRSCVLQIQSGEQRVLLPGDVEQRAERQLVQRYGATLRSQILIAPHHGSAGSSSNELVQAVAPDWVLFSTGYRNLYDFPKREVVERWRGQGASVLNTAQDGAIQFHISPVTHLDRPERYCADPSHYWQNCPVSDFRYVSAKDASGNGQ